MSNIYNQYRKIKEALDCNQQEYKEKQSRLLKQLEELQDNCPHLNTMLVTVGEPHTKCHDCSKIILNKKNKFEEGIENAGV